MKLKRNILVPLESRGLGRGRLFVALVVLATGGACNTSASKQQSTARETGNLAERCEVKPPFTGNFEPELQWEWKGSQVLPTHKQVMMQPVVVDVNRDGTPDIVFSTFDGDFYNTAYQEGRDGNADGVLRAVSGSTGQEIWTVEDSQYRVKPAASIAAGDIDGDGAVEICGIPESGRGIICFENDGTFKFRTVPDANDYSEWGGLSLADLDGDGAVEILNGNRVYSNTGALKWVGSDGMGGALFTGPVSFAADIDQDGKQEVINGRSVYRHDGSLKCANTQIPHGFAAVANFDGDAAGEIVVVGKGLEAIHGRVSLLDDNCELLWTREVHLTGADLPLHDKAGHGGAPNIGDFDGDGQLEIGLAGDWNYTVYGSDGTVKWTFPIQEYSSGKTTSTTFDFEDDGRLEVIYTDELKLRIFDGVTGALRWETAHSSGTTHEFPIVADVDGDGAAEIVTVENNHGAPGFNGVRVWHDKKEGWAGTRKIWNQHAYAITNVNNDGTIPSQPASNWLNPKLNNFRSNVANYFGEGPSPFAAADLLAFDVVTSCDGYGSLILSARVRNEGEAPVPAGVKVAFYKGNPASGRTLLGVATVPDALPVGGSSIATVSVSSTSFGTAEVWAVADDDGTGTGTIAECREDNNGASATGNLTCTVTSTNKPPVALCRDVTVHADTACQGGASVNNGSYDPDNGPSPLSISEVPNTPFGLGTHPVTLTASDGEASDQCVGNVTVVDDTKPAVNCPASQVIETCSPAGAPATFAASATDHCSPATLSCSYASGSTFPVGQTPVGCSAQDAAGNSASCGFNVTVVGDTTPPVISCPTSPIVIRACAPNGTRVNYVASATDNCGEVAVNCSHPSGSTFPVGETAVTCSTQDVFGNTASCGFSVIVGGNGGGGGGGHDDDDDGHGGGGGHDDDDDGHGNGGGGGHHDGDGCGGGHHDDDDDGHGNGGGGGHDDDDDGHGNGGGGGGGHHDGDGCGKNHGGRNNLVTRNFGTHFKGDGCGGGHDDDDDGHGNGGGGGGGGHDDDDDGHGNGGGGGHHDGDGCGGGHHDDDDDGHGGGGGHDDDDDGNGGGGGDDVCGYCNDGAPVAGADKGVQVWPPNHKFITISLSECAQPATDSCGNTLPLDTYGHVLRVTSDEVEDANGNGDGRTCEDMSVIVGKSFVQVRSEREGGGDGRVYTIHYAITNDAGVSTQSTCRVIIPHDQSGRTVVDSGVKYCVGQGCPEGITEGSPLCK
ncbi:FG-GAP-like repeat-containing protein [Archangium lansingense]|uniref:HYR domain-containing protein n=1 Tax=Archangium lansingense TaxID=2995310 RepID=A0ABT4A7Y3_9BACT|nr:FG-GAP-like repeat-containing protein [Archangium lansinium]MCY1077064.1 HYR domain-containing protein [Archangium lansinium]